MVSIAGVTWLHASTAFVAAFLASLVECVEALTIVLAVGTTRGWRSVLLGAAASALFLIILVAIFGPALGRVPITTLQLIVGILLLLFGIRWLRNTLTTFAANGGTVFLSTHLIGELEKFADDLIVIGAGKLLAAESVATTIARDPSRPLEEILLDMTSTVAEFASV